MHTQDSVRGDTVLQRTKCCMGRDRPLLKDERIEDKRDAIVGIDVLGPQLLFAARSERHRRNLKMP